MIASLIASMIASLSWSTPHDLFQEWHGEVGGDKLKKLIEEEENVVVLYHESKTSKSVFKAFETLNQLHQTDFTFVRTKEDCSAVGCDKLPQLVFFKQGLSNTYEGDVTDASGRLNSLETTSLVR